MWHRMEDIANDFSKSQLQKASFRPGVIYAYVRIKGLPTCIVPDFIYGIILAEKYIQIHINAFKSSFHRKCKTDLAVHVLNLPCSYPA